MPGGLGKVSDTAKQYALRHWIGRLQLLRGFNALGRLFPQNGVPFLTLKKDDLLEKARKLTGLSDFGDGSVDHRLEILLRSLKEDANLSLVGRICAHSDILRLLCNRLLLEEDRKPHPEMTSVIPLPWWDG